MIIFLKRNHITVSTAGATCFHSSIPVLGLDPPASPHSFHSLAAWLGVGGTVWVGLGARLLRLTLILRGTSWI